MTEADRPGAGSAWPAVCPREVSSCEAAALGLGPVRGGGAAFPATGMPAIKREEKKTDQHYLASLPAALPALMRAQKAQGKVARVNFDWKELRDVIVKVEEELGELKAAIQSQDRQSTEDEIGDLLFAVANLARKCKLDAETALQSATDKFVRRFNLLEDKLRARGKKLGDADLPELDAIWNEIKRK